MDDNLAVPTEDAPATGQGPVRRVAGRFVFPLFMAAIVVAFTAAGQSAPDSLPFVAAPAVTVPQSGGAVDGAGIDALIGLAGEVDADSPSATALPVLGAEPAATPPSTVPDVSVAEMLDRSGAVVATAVVTEGVVEVWDLPDASVDPAWALSVPTEFGGPRHFAVLGSYGDWYRIQVPVRPNGSTGWIPADAVTVRPVSTRIEVDLSERRIVVRDGDVVVLDELVTIGATNTPTPTGSFYIRDEFPWYADSVYGPWVLALSAFSESIDQINGGAAVVALHGTVRPDLVGQSASLGCVRLPNELITRLAELVEVGTPVVIVD